MLSLFSGCFWAFFNEKAVNPYEDFIFASAKAEQSTHVFYSPLRHVITQKSCTTILPFIVAKNFFKKMSLTFSL
jgi:hypothetical protein